jgi:type I restriction enzyme R subunit
MRSDPSRRSRSILKEQTRADVEVFILNEVFSKLPTPPFSADEKNEIAREVYAHVWQQAAGGHLSASL